MISTAIAPFSHQLREPLSKKKITVLQINLGKKCNLTCNHCHVEASPKRTEEMSPEICQQLITIINQFPQIQTIDLTGGAPEMLYGFKPLVEAGRSQGKEVIVRSNLTIYWENGFDDIPEYCAKNQLRIVASLPCYLSSNVDKIRGDGVFDASIKALQWLNSLGYGKVPNLILDLVYNPPVPTTDKFSLTPEQQKLQQDYKNYLNEHFGIVFNHLFTITNLPIGRTKFQLEKHKIYQSYIRFLADNFNGNTVENLMCRNELSIDYLGNVYDCDFNQMEHLPARSKNREKITVKTLLEAGNLDIISEVQTANYCYGCTAGAGSSCAGALI
jgi:radical SAM/Cys-rich protein